MSKSRQRVAPRLTAQLIGHRIAGADDGRLWTEQVEVYEAPPPYPEDAKGQSARRQPCPLEHIDTCVGTARRG